MSTEKSVCVVHNSMRTLYIFRISYIRMLISEGYLVHCLAPGDDIQSTKLLTEAGAVVHEAANSTRALQAISMNWIFLRYILFSNRSIVVLCHFISTVVMALPILILNRRSILFIEGIGTFFTGRTLATKLMRLIMRFGGQVRIFMNEYEKGLLGVDSDLVLGGIGVDLDHFKLEPQDRFESNDTAQLLYVGRLVRDKGIYDVIEIASRLREKKVPFKLTIVGDIYKGNPGSLTAEEMDSFIQEFSQNITVHAFNQNIAQFYQSADLLLLLSKHEGFPTVVMEANACGVPALCYDVVGCNDAIEDGVNGYCVAKQDLDEAVRIIVEKKYLGQGESSRQYAEQNFNQNSKNAQILAEIKLLCE